MNIKGLATKLCADYVLPHIKKIAKSLISNIGKSAYEKLYSRFTKALESFEEALEKCFETNDLKKLEKRLKCCKLGLAFFEKMNSVLDGVLADYNAAVLEAEEKYKKLGGGILEVEDES